MANKNYCPVCGKQCEFKFCCGDHRKEYWRKKQNEKYAILHKSMVFDKTCVECGKDYKSKSSQSLVCKKKKCRNAHNRKIAKARVALMSDEARKAYYRQRFHRTSVQQQSFKATGEVLLAKCPGCGIMHEYRFEPAWIGTGIPRKNCPRYPFCITERIDSVPVCDIMGSWNEATI